MSSFRVIFLSLFISIFFLSVGAQEQQPDVMILLNGKEQRVKFTKEDANFIYFKVFAGAAAMKEPWTNVQEIKYRDMTKNMQIAEGDFAAGGYKSCIRNYEKVLADMQAETWEKTKAKYRMAIAHKNTGNAEEAKKLFESIDPTSRWYYDSQLDLIDTLPDKEKVSAMEKLINSQKVTGPFLVKLKFMLLDRYVAENVKGSAAKVFGELQKEASSKEDKEKLEEYSIVIGYLNREFSKVKTQIAERIKNNQDSAKIRIILGSVLKEEKKLEEAKFEFLRARLMFDTNVAEAAYEASLVFYELYGADKEKNATYKKYAIKELKIARQSEDPIWSVKANDMLKQIVR